MRTFNFRLLALLMLGTVLVSSAAYALHEFQVTRNAAVLLREANQAKERKDVNEAIDFLERYTALVKSKDVSALADLGLLQADAHRSVQAFQTLESVLRQDRSRADIRRRLVEVALSIGRFADARQHLDILLKDAPEDAELRGLLSHAQVGLQDYDAARDALDRALKQASDRLDLYELWASLEQDKFNKPDLALSALNKMVENNPDAPRAYVVRGAYLLAHRHDRRSQVVKGDSPTEGDSPAKGPERDDSGDGASEKDDSGQNGSAKNGEPREDESAQKEQTALVAALSDARSALRLASNDQAVVVFAVRCFLANGRLEEAAIAAKRGLKLFPKSSSTYSSLADVELKANQRQKAVAWLKRGVEVVPEGIPEARDLLWNLAQLQIEEGNIKELEEAEKHLEQLRKQNYFAPPIAYLEARLLIEKKEWSAASQRLDAVRAVLTEWPDLSKQADYRLGQCYQELGRPDLQLTAYRRAAGVDANWLPARLGVASALVSMGRLDEALEQYRLIVELPGAPVAVLAELARLAILVNLPRKESERDWESARKILDQLEELDPETPAVPILRAEMLLAKRDDVNLDEAEKLLTEACDKSPKTLDFWLGLARIARLRNDAARAGELLEEARKVVGDSVPLRLAQGRELVYRQGKDARDALHELAQTSDAFGEEDEMKLYAGLAGLTLAVDDVEETERLCRLVAERQPANLRVRLMQFDLAFGAKRAEAMERVLAEVQRIENSGPLWHYGEAIRLCLLAESEKSPAFYAQAKQHLAEARIARPGWSRIPLLLAEINLLQQDPDAAIANFMQAIDLGERDANVIGHTAKLLRQRRRYEDADLLIRRLQQQSSPFSTELTQVATEVSLQLKDPDRALEFVTKADFTDPRDLIWAGHVFKALGKYPEAEESFKKAIEKEASSAAAWVELIQLFGRTSQVQKAEEALAEAETKIAPAEAPLALAEALEAIGKPAEAERQYKAAVAAAADPMPVIRQFAEFYLLQGRPNDAQPLLERLTEANSGALEGDRLWGRRNLALMLLKTRRGDEAAVKQALALVNENLAVQNDSDDDRQAKARVLASLPDQDSQLEAVEILEKLLGERQSQPVEGGSGESRFLLVQIYLQFRDESKARSHLVKLMAAHGDKPLYLRTYVEFLIDRKELSDAELWLDKLVKAAPREIDTLKWTTTILFRRERYAELLESVEKFLTNFNSLASNPDGNDPELGAMRLEAAKLLEFYARELKEREEGTPAESQQWAARLSEQAEALYGGYSADRPQDALTLAAFYGRRGRHAESLDILDKEWLTARPELIIGVTSTLLTSAGATKEDFARAEKVLRSALDKQARSLSLLTAYADLQNWREKYDDAEQLYREVLKKNPRDPVACNNLAVLLALRGRGSGEQMVLIERSLKTLGDNPSVLDTRATIRMLQGNAQGAADDLDRALRLRPFSQGYFHLAQVKLRLGQLDDARKAMSQAREMRLRIEELHPLERPAYRQLDAELR